jgi:2-dehydropantoate 2-reductase
MTPSHHPARAGTMASIHILGLGNMGKYVAYALMRQQQQTPRAGVRPPTLLFHRPALLADWKKADRSIRCTAATSQGLVEGPRAGGFSIDLLGPTATTGAQPAISYLIVATKAHATAAALAPLRHRLDEASVGRQVAHLVSPKRHGFVCPVSAVFARTSATNETLGVENELNKSVFPDVRTRPTYWAGICSAGVYSASPFGIVHAGRGPLIFGLLGPGTAPQPSLAENAMAVQLSDAELLAAELVPSDKLMQAQMRKLVINAVINPLTALYDCKNGELLGGGVVSKGVVDQLVHEAGVIIRALPSFRAQEQLQAAFSDEALRGWVDDVAEATAENTSSMLQDVRGRRKTEIDYINGYLVRQALAVGKPCAHHEALVREIKQLSADHTTP